jgi:preprotein translocase subunit SecD
VVRHTNRHAAALAIIPLLVLTGLTAACGGNDGAVGASVRIVLQADFSQVPDIDAEEALKSAADIIQRRVDAYGATAEVRQEGANRLSVDLAGIGAAQAQELIGRTGLLEFRVPKLDEEGNVIICEGGTVIYDPPGCQGGTEIAVSPYSVAPEAAPGHFIWVTATPSPGKTPTEGSWGPSFMITATAAPDSAAPETYIEKIIWVPALATSSDGQETALTGRFLKANTFVGMDSITGWPELRFEMTDEGAPLLEQVTKRLVGLPLAFFLDGEPIRGEDGRIIAPTVQSVITDQGRITGLSADDARMLSILLNSGALPMPLQIMEVEELSE